jgi:hypothetical protein
MVALEQIRRGLGHLPAAVFSISPAYPDQLDISLHSDLGDFEAWRGALGIPSATVTYGTQTGACLLRAIAQWGGATVELAGYGPLPKPDADGADQQ